MAFAENTRPLTTLGGRARRGQPEQHGCRATRPVATARPVADREARTHFSREVITERRMHAKGAGALGTFPVTHDISAYTDAAISAYTGAAIFAEIGSTCEMFARYSTVAGERWRVGRPP